MHNMAVVFDSTSGTGTFRDDMYAEYKANREAMPDDLLNNLPYIKEIVRALDIPVIEIPGVEPGFRVAAQPVDLRRDVHAALDPGERNRQLPVSMLCRPHAGGGVG